MHAIIDRVGLLFGDRLIQLGYRLSYALIMITAYLTAQATWQAIDLWLPTADSTPYESFSPPTYKEELKPDSLWRWGRYVDMYQVPKPEAPTNDIKLDVRIEGLIHSEGGSLAMLRIGKEASKLYSEKDPLKDGVSVDKIGTNSITLRKQENTRVIEFTNFKSNIFLEAVPDVPEQEAIDTSNQNNAEQETEEDRVEDIAVDQLSSDYQQEITQFKDKVAKKPLEALKDFEFNPVQEGDTLLGWSLRYNVNPELLRALGLLPTDIIISVNDIAAAELAKNPGMVAGLMDLKEYKVVVRRDGAIKTLNIKL